MLENFESIRSLRRRLVRIYLVVKWWRCGLLCMVGRLLMCSSRYLFGVLVRCFIRISYLMESIFVYVNLRGSNFTFEIAFLY